MSNEHPKIPLDPEVALRQMLDKRAKTPVDLPEKPHALSEEEERLLKAQGKKGYNPPPPTDPDPEGGEVPERGEFPETEVLTGQVKVPTRAERLKRIANVVDVALPDDE